MRWPEVIKLITDAGFKLARRGKQHDLYRHPSGLVFTASRGTSCHPSKLATVRSLIRRAQAQAA